MKRSRLTTHTHHLCCSTDKSCFQNRKQSHPSILYIKEKSCVLVLAERFPFYFGFVPVSFTYGLNLLHPEEKDIRFREGKKKGRLCGRSLYLRNGWSHVLWVENEKLPTFALSRTVKLDGRDCVVNCGV